MKFIYLCKKFINLDSFFRKQSTIYQKKKKDKTNFTSKIPYTANKD